MITRVELYTIDRTVRCLKCGGKGAVKSYGVWYPNGIGDIADKSEALSEYRNKPYMDHILGPGGVIPYECLNCGAVGLANCSLEGYKMMFEKELAHA